MIPSIAGYYFFLGCKAIVGQYCKQVKQFHKNWFIHALSYILQKYIYREISTYQLIIRHFSSKLNISLLCAFCFFSKELHCIHTFKTVYLKYSRLFRINLECRVKSTLRRLESLL